MKRTVTSMRRPNFPRNLPSRDVAGAMDDPATDLVTRSTCSAATPNAYPFRSNRCTRVRPLPSISKWTPTIRAPHVQPLRRRPPSSERNATSATAQHRLIWRHIPCLLRAATPAGQHAGSRRSSQQPTGMSMNPSGVSYLSSGARQVVWSAGLCPTRFSRGSGPRSFVNVFRPPCNPAECYCRPSCNRQLQEEK
jgi:hypothetical protein